MKRKILAGVLFSLTAVLLFYIFSFSAQDADTSSSLSREATRTLMGLMNPGYLKTAPESTRAAVEEFLHLPVRKAAHFSEYALLGALLMGAFLCLRLSMGTRLVLTVFLCFLCACADEYHQTFVTGRSGQWSDVLLDFSGSVAGILLVFTVCLAVLYLIGASRLRRAARPGRKRRPPAYRSAPSPSGKRVEF